MGNLIYKKDIHLISDFEEMERDLMNIPHFSNLNRKARMYWKRAYDRLQSIKASHCKEPKNSMLQMADIMNFYLAMEHVEGLTLNLFKDTYSRKERFAVYDHQMSNEINKNQNIKSNYENTKHIN